MLASRISLPRGTVRHGPDLGQNLSRQSLSTTTATTTTTRRCVSTLSTQPIASRHTVDGDSADGHPPVPRRVVSWRLRSHKYLVDSPNATLALRLKSRTAPLTFAAWQRFDAVARSRSMRLPVVVLQMMMRQDEAAVQAQGQGQGQGPGQTRQTSLSESLCDAVAWRTRLNSLAYKGTTEADMQHWLWILAAADADERVERFVAHADRPKPIFLLFQLLRRDVALQKSSSLAALYQYILRHHVQARRASLADAGGTTTTTTATTTTTTAALATTTATALPFGAIRRSLDPGLNMTPQSFAMLMRLLVHQYLRLWPSALPAVARLAAAYMETLPGMARSRVQNWRKNNGRKAHADACFLFNYGLVLFQNKAPVNPLANMRHNWRAQKVLLTLSATTATATTTAASAATGAEGGQPVPRPLMINRDGFRAIRRVMLGLGKSPAERRVALRMVRTWPPYRRDWDGLDEQRGPEDDFSRSVMAGVLMREAGYADGEHDRALSVMGGVLPDESPTVQTRSLSPRTWTGRKTSLNVFSTWAARVKATRDVNEAWHEFQIAPEGGGGGIGHESDSENGPPWMLLRPNVQVYAEMFKKMVAAPVDTDDSLGGGGVGIVGRTVLPGDAREVFPVNDATLTAFEKQRLKPPSLATLYAQMLCEGIRPVGDCLAVLLQHAPSLAAGAQYLRDSHLVDRRTIAALQLPYASARELSHAPVCLLGSLTGAPASPPFDSHPYAHPHQPLPPLEVLRPLPLASLNAYIHLMCRFQPRMTAEPARVGKLRRVGLVYHAINLCLQRLPLRLGEGRTYKAPWHAILRVLAAPRLLVTTHRTHDQRLHDVEALSLLLRVLGHTRQMAGGMDVVMLDSLCRAMQKCLRWADVGAVEEDGSGSASASASAGSTPPAAPPDAIRSEATALLRVAHSVVVAAFQEMAMLPQAACNGAQDVGATLLAPHHPSTAHNITASHLQRYLQTLGYLGDTAGMVQAMRWIVRMWSDESVLEDAKDMDHGQHATMGRVFVMFRAFTETRAAAEVLDGLERELWQQNNTRGCTWQWPTREDADEYVRWHLQEHNAAFWSRVRPWVTGYDEV